MDLRDALVIDSKDPNGKKVCNKWQVPISIPLPLATIYYLHYLRLVKVD